MKITKTRLKQIIKEEVENILEGPYDHDEETDPMSGMPVYRKKERNPFK